MEQLGYGAWWVGGSPKVPGDPADPGGHDDAHRGDGDPQRLGQRAGRDGRAGRCAARSEFPGRFVLGIGIGHPEATSDYRRPLTAMRAFLDGLDAAPAPPPAEERVLAALRPRMLELARERSAGAHTYFVPVEHTRTARERLGPGKLLAPELACVVETDPDRARAGRPRLRGALPRPEQLHEQPARPRLHGGRSRRRRLGPPDRRRDPARQRGGDRGGRARPPRRGSRSRLPAAAGRGGHPPRVLVGTREGPAQLTSREIALAARVGQVTAGGASSSR